MTVRRVTAFGEVGSLAHFARKYRITYSALQMRMWSGWSIERALTEPVRESRPMVARPGDTHNGWTVVCEEPPKTFACGQKHRQVTVKCACGAERVLILEHVVHGHTRRCRACSADAAKRVIEIDGRPRRLADVLAENGVSRNTFDVRRMRGWSVERAATTPPAALGGRTHQRYLANHPEAA